MYLFARLTVRARLLAGFAALAAAVLLVSAFAVRALSDEHEMFARFVAQDSQRVALAKEVLAAANARAIAARNLVLVTAATDREAEKAAVARAHAEVGARLAQLRQLVAEGGTASAREREQVAAIERIEARYGRVALEIVELALAGQHERAVAKMNADCRPLLVALVQAGSDYLGLAQAQAAESVRAGDAAYAARRSVMVAMCVAALGLAIGLPLLITRSLLRSLGAEPAVLRAATERLAAGDLGPLPGAEAAPAGSVLASMATTQASLARVVQQVRQASEAIATGSAQIATGNADLSQRTEEQASNLQQTAASTEQMSGTVRHNADTARQASGMAARAGEVAARGGAVVTQVVATMDEINQSSRRIADIIGVIDGIAFQTNILALNAAVEAARAGEQGRGFAVVAGEVRNLAQRSAAAAREIKGLIGSSVEKVAAGSRLVDAAGTTMGEIVDEVQRVVSLISEISVATAEQTSGVEQINLAVSQLDQVTQQNAALVEQSAAAAEGLNQQARRLVETIAVFRLPDGAGVGDWARA